ncbi:MAG: hypothetical protein M1575_01310 [Patescibacteria group bacterium]|nr:hypothetical protein [Patescibacteria group bacterium]MCL5095354.1 hypothetical protein [Patescibacteria group bacterium]
MNKKFTKILSDKYGHLSPQKVRELCQAIKLFRSQLKLVNIQTPYPYKILCTNKKVKIIEPFYNKLLSQEMTKCNLKEYKNYVNKLLDLLTKIKSQEKITVSIDPKPDNFAILNNNLIYLDATPPLINHKQFYWMFIRKNERDQKISWKVNRYFNFERLTLSCFLQIAIIRPEFINHLVMYFHLPFPKKPRKKFVLSITPKDRDYLRLIYIISNKDRLIKKEVSRFFKISKSTNTFDDAKKKLLSTL